MRGLCHQPLDLLYEFAYGNPGNPPYANAAGTGNWLANHDNPMAVAADEKQIYIAAPQSEGATTVLATDYHGQRQWGHGNISGGMMVRQGEYLYMLVGGAVYAPFVPEGEVHITRLDPASGKYMPFADGKYSHKIAEIPADWSHWPDYKPLRPEGELVATHGYDAACCLRQTLGLAAANGRLYASLFHQGQIVVVDPEKGEAVGQIALEHPAGLAADAAGAVYALSDRHLVKIAPDEGQSVFVAEGLSAPVGLATDRQGNIYVSDWGDGDVREGVFAAGPVAAHDRARRRPAAGRDLRPARHVPSLGSGRSTAKTACGWPNTTPAPAASASGTPPPVSSSASSAARPTTERWAHTSTSSIPVRPS